MSSITFNSGSEEITIPVSDESSIIIQTIPDGGPVGNYTVDHNELINLTFGNPHPQYLLSSEGITSTELSTHTDDTTLHYLMGDISIAVSQLTDFTANSISTALYGSDATNLVKYTTTEQNRITTLENDLTSANIYTLYHTYNSAVFNTTKNDYLSTLTGNGSTTLHKHDRANLDGTQLTSTVIANLAVPADEPLDNTVKTLTGLLAHSESAGVITNISSISVSVDTNSVVLPNMDVLIRKTDSEGSELFVGYFASASVPIIEGLNIICIKWDSVTESLVSFNTTNPNLVNMHTVIPVCIVNKQGTVVNILIVGNDSVDSNAKLRKKLFFSEPFTRESGAVVTTSGIQFACTAGSFWFGLKKETNAEKLLAGNFNYVYKNGANTWSINPFNTLQNTDTYNDGTVLTSVTNKYYYNYFVYHVFGTGVHNSTAYYVVHGQAEFATASEALEESLTDLPPIINTSTSAILLARFTMIEGTPTSIYKVTDFLTGTTGVTSNGVYSAGWKDMISPLSAAGVPSAAAPTYTPFGTAVAGGDTYQAYAFALNDYLFALPMHVNHDIIPNSAAYVHVHWSTNGTSTASVKWQITIRRALGHNQESFNNASNTVITVEQAASGTAWQHMVTETTTPITLIEPDELILITIKRITNGGTDNTNTVFGLMVDIHYQSDRDFTPNKSPDFYV